MAVFDTCGIGTTVCGFGSEETRPLADLLLFPDNLGNLKTLVTRGPIFSSTTYKHCVL